MTSCSEVLCHISLFCYRIFGSIMLSVYWYSRSELPWFKNRIDSQNSLGPLIAAPQRSYRPNKFTHVGWHAALKCTLSIKILISSLLSRIPQIISFKCLTKWVHQRGRWEVENKENITIERKLIWWLSYIWPWSFHDIDDVHCLAMEHNLQLAEYPNWRTWWIQTKGIRIPV